MFNSGIIDLALTLAFTYFILALIASTVVEIINNITNERGKLLHKALKEFYFDKNKKTVDADWNKFLKNNILNSPFIESLTTKKLFTKNSRYPSYIPAKNFSQAVLSFILNDSDVSGNKTDIDLKTLLTENKNIPVKFRETLLTLNKQADGNINKFIENLEGFYNNAVDRMTGEFKRYTQFCMFFLGLGIAISLNADTIHISKSLWKNKEQLKLTSDAIENKLSGIKITDGKYVIGSLISDTDNGKVTDIILDKKNSDKIDSLLSDISNQKSLLNSLTDIPLGWENTDNPFTDKNGIFSISFLTKLAGWLITTLAIYLGAPFWFELVNKIVNIRGTGKRPEEILK